jgi:hypothetical protein
MTMVKQLFLGAILAAALAACGGHKPAAETAEAEPMERSSGPINDSDSATTMVPPEKMDEINNLLARKQQIVSRCLATAVDAGELPKNARGRITLEIVISPAGRADSIKVVKKTLESKSIEDCVIAHVRQIQFPDLPKPYPTSYTYAFEAM